MNTTPQKDCSHPTVLLLPWYLTGKLKDVVRQAMEAHLAICQFCQQELKEVRQMWKGVKAYYIGCPGPPPQAREKVIQGLSWKKTSRGQEKH